MLKSFLYTNKLNVISKNLTILRERELKNFIKELSSYNISIHDLVNSTPDFELRNIFLNIAFFIFESDDLFLFVTEKKKLPVKKLASILKESPDFIHKWRHYIIAYFILFSNEKYKHLQNFLSISTVEDTDFREDLSIENSKSNIKGVLINQTNSKCYILTSYGSFLSIKPYDTCPIGGIVIGFIPSKLKVLKKSLIILVLVSVIVLPSYYYFYNTSKSTVILEMEGKITIQLNKSNKIISLDGSNYFTQSVLNTISDKSSLDTVISKLLSDAVDNKKINSYSKLSIYINGKPIDFNSLTKTKDVILASRLKVKVNNSGNDYYFNE